MFDYIKKRYIRKAYNYVNKDPENNLPRFLDLIDFYGRHSGYKRQIDGFREIISNQESNWQELILSFWDLDEDVRRTIFENFIIKANLEWGKKREEKIAKYDCNIPWTILIDPTSACNLKCIGCWAAEYGNKLNLSYETLNSIIMQGKDLGIYMYLFSGGEPLVRKKDIIRLCEEHDDCQFLAFTNGTLIDEQFCLDMLRVKNFIPAISVEGFEQATDFRRGEGTFKRVDNAMNLLKKHRLPFGISCCYTSQNIDIIGSEEYFDWMIEKSAKFCWFFTYMPIGTTSPTDLMVTAEQREEMYHRIREFRKTKPLFTIDFWNDGQYVNGCIAGGRNYLHINANGDIEPCAFIHYSNSNIHQDSLLDGLRSPLFMEYRKGQPFNENHLRPCPLLDNHKKLQGMVERSHAHSTDLQQPEDIRDLTEKCKEKSEKWAKTAERLWNQSH
ncbi:MAG: radical SAM protein [Tissierellia bacterium]|nr:radical SAM protein [Tissierellia bacterium]